MSIYILDYEANNKTKKKKICLIAVALIILLLITIFLINIGILVLPNLGYKMYFKINQDSFEEIVKYAEKPDSELDVDFGTLESDLSKITDDRVASEAESLIKSSLFLFISEHKDTHYDDGKEIEVTVVDFDINNLLNYDNTAVCIIYSPYPVVDHPCYYDDRDYWLSYEQLDDNWYLEIWHKDKK